MSEQLVRVYFKNAIKRKRLAHAYLLWGPGENTRDEQALEIAKSLACPNGQENNSHPCGKCKTCHEISVNAYAGFIEVANDQHVIEIDTIRKLASQLAIAFEKRRIVFIPKLERLSIPAENAFLKILEEPGGQTVYLLTTGNTSNLLSTITSRCHRLPFFVQGEDQEKTDFPELNAIFKDLKGLYQTDPKNLLKYFTNAGKKRDQVMALFNYLLMHIKTALSTAYGNGEIAENIFQDQAIDGLLELSEKILLLSEDIPANINLDLLLEELVISFSHSLKKL